MSFLSYKTVVDRFLVVAPAVAGLSAPLVPALEPDQEGREQQRDDDVVEWAEPWDKCRHLIGKIGCFEK